MDYKGQCLNCQKPVKDQSYCDYCSDGDGKYKCGECGEIFKSLTPLSFCWQHESDIEDLREICAELQGEIEKLASRARYKEEEIQELKHDIEFWKQGYKVMAALAEEYRKFIEEKNAQDRALMGGGMAEHGRN